MTFERRFQVEILPDLEWEVLVERFGHAERLGFDLAVTADQFVDWKNPSTPWLDLWPMLAGIAQATDTIRLAPCVAQIPMRDPATFARQALTVDQISNGRVEIGIGLGLTVDPGYDMMGLPNWSNPERADRFGEYIEIVAHMVSNTESTITGDYYSVTGAIVHASKQSPRIPITIAAMGPRMMRYAATHADTWNTMSFEPDFEQQLSDATARVIRMATVCDDVGRDPESLRHSYLMFDPNARASGGRLVYYDSPERFVDMAGRLFDAGFDEIGVYYPALESQLDVFESVATDVIPTLRAR